MQSLEIHLCHLQFPSSLSRSLIPNNSPLVLTQILSCSVRSPYTSDKVADAHFVSRSSVLSLCHHISIWKFIKERRYYGAYKKSSPVGSGSSITGGVSM